MHDAEHFRLAAMLLQLKPNLLHACLLWLGSILPTSSRTVRHARSLLHTDEAAALLGHFVASGGNARC